MLPVEPDLEIRSKLPSKSTDKPPLLFVHGGYCDAWCWEPYFLPWFAERGFPSYALSLRGHGGSAGRETLFIAGIDDYETDVEYVAGKFDEPPILIGHSMGAAVVERILAKRPVRGAALVAPVPPAGVLPMAARLATRHADSLFHMAGIDPTQLSVDVLETLRPFYFGSEVPAALLIEATRHLGIESPRALLDLSLRLHWAPPVTQTSPILVLGATGDLICTPDDVRATASHHGVDAQILPGLAHMLMLEPRWVTAASAIEAWLRRVD